jgi:hypothetical protein
MERLLMRAQEVAYRFSLLLDRARVMLRQAIEGT